MKIVIKLLIIGVLFVANFITAIQFDKVEKSDCKKSEDILYKLKTVFTVRLLLYWVIAAIMLMFALAKKNFGFWEPDLIEFVVFVAFAGGNLKGRRLTEQMLKGVGSKKSAQQSAICGVKKMSKKNIPEDNTVCGQCLSEVSEKVQGGKLND